MSKIKYNVSSHNQLIIKPRCKSIKPAGFFKLGKKRRLVYKITEPKIWRQKNKLPEKVVFEGRWKLDKSHNLIFVLRKTKKQFAGQKLYLKGQLSDVCANTLSFALATKFKNEADEIRMLRFQGKWHADETNRLNFLIQRSKTQYDRLVLQGGWQVENNVLIYRYQKAALKTKVKKDIKIVFKGFWQITERDRITYVLEGKNNSFFSFKIETGSASVIGKKGMIKRRIGIGVRAGKGDLKIITLAGRWKIGRRTGIMFEMDYGQQNYRRMRFKTFVRIAKGNRIIFSLRNQKGENLGIQVEFERRFLKSNARLFLRLGQTENKAYIKGGISFAW